MNTQSPRVIEQTAKKWKGMMLIGFLIGCLGACILVSAGDNQGAAGSGGLLAISGFVLFLFGKLGGWWNHG